MARRSSPAGQRHPVVQSGRHWYAELKISGIPEGTEQKAIWERIKPSLLQGGWTVLAEFDQNPFSAMLRYQKNGKDAWASLGIFSADDMRMDFVEVGPPTLKFTLSRRRRRRRR